MSKSLTNQLFLKWQLDKLLIKEGTSIHDHLNSIICQLSSVRFKIEEEDKTLILLAFLPPSFKHLVTTFYKFRRCHFYTLIK